MTIRELLDELRRIAEMQSMVDSMDQSAHSGNACAARLLVSAIERTRAGLRARFSSRRLEAAARMHQLLSEEAT